MTEFDVCRHNDRVFGLFDALVAKETDQAGSRLCHDADLCLEARRPIRYICHCDRDRGLAIGSGVVQCDRDYLYFGVVIPPGLPNVSNRSQMLEPCLRIFRPFNGLSCSMSRALEHESTSRNWTKPYACFSEIWPNFPYLLNRRNTSRLDTFSVGKLPARRDKRSTNQAKT